MRIWECDMCHERFDKELRTLGFDGIRVWDICPDCIKSVTDFVTGKYNDRLKKIVEKAKEPVEPRKTCNTCVHFMAAKSRCLKKNIQIHENDRDACLGWSDKKHCSNCRFYPTCSIPDSINQDVGCIKWES